MHDASAGLCRTVRLVSLKFDPLAPRDHEGFGSCPADHATGRPDEGWSDETWMSCVAYESDLGRVKPGRPSMRPAARGVKMREVGALDLARDSHGRKHSSQSE
jgi:hypothetical protein